RTYGDALWNVLTEQLHHRGQVFILMSSMGVKPPEI
ncbi:MAG: damage-inducible protein DinB, partial [Candidatus Thorarchaeota archaeon]